MNKDLELRLEVLSSVELKSLAKAVESERKRRGRKSPDNHESPKWLIPQTALNGQSV